MTISTKRTDNSTPARGTNTKTTPLDGRSFTMGTSSKSFRRQKESARGTKGWVGIVLSDMANNWYRVDWEYDYLAYSADMVKSHFNNFFKPIA